MVEFLIFAFSTIGMTHILVDGSIMEPLRVFVKSLAARVKVPKLGEIIDCYLCTGTWCGFLMGGVWLVDLEPSASCALRVLGCGCAGGFLSNLAAMVLNYLEAGTLVNMPTSPDDR